MSQYGKPEYWEERYTRHFKLILLFKNINLYLEIQNLLIGTKDFLELKNSLFLNQNL